MLKFAVIESLFADLLAQPMTALSNSELEEIREYVDVGEYGLALRTAAAIFREEKQPATPRERELIQRLAIEMSLDPNVLRMNVPS